MAWHIHKHIVSGVIDNRQKGQITGTLWLVGREEPIQLKLAGNASGDVAGCLLSFFNARPTPGNLQGFSSVQEGRCGDFTVSRNVKSPMVWADQAQPDDSPEASPFRWIGNPYFEWFSERNGRVVIEGADYTMTCSDPAWQRKASEAESEMCPAARDLPTFVDQMSAATGAVEVTLPLPDPFI